MKFGRMQCKDIPTRPILELLLANRGRWCLRVTSPEMREECEDAGYGYIYVDDAMPPGIGERLVLGKMRSLLRRGLVDGCCCGCRGDFEITEKGEAFLGALVEQGIMNDEPVECQPRGGEDISDAARRLVALARSSGKTAGMTFNGIGLTATAGTDPREVARLYDAESERRAEAYRNSAEGRAREERDAEEARVRRATADAMIRVLESLDFADTGRVLAWVREFTPMTHRGIGEGERARVFAAFRSRGFEPDACCGESYRPDDRENVARYVIGQMLSTLAACGAVHPMVAVFAERWQDEFEDTTMKPSFGGSGTEGFRFSRREDGRLRINFEDQGGINCNLGDGPPDEDDPAPILRFGPDWEGMELTQDMVRAILPYLVRFADTGTIEAPEGDSA